MTTEEALERVEAQLGWEHKSVGHRSADTLVVLLDEMAAEGWELVSTLFHPEGKIVAFMRRRIVT